MTQQEQLITDSLHRRLWERQGQEGDLRFLRLNSRFSVKLTKHARDRLRAALERPSHTFPLGSASSTPLSQSWRLFWSFVSLDIDKCITGENGKWKFVRRVVTGTVANAVAFHTAQRKMRLNNSSINNIYACQSTTSNQKAACRTVFPSSLWQLPWDVWYITFVSSWIKKTPLLSVHVLLQCSQYSGSLSAKLPCSGASWNPYLGVWHSFALNMLYLCKL